MSSSKHRTGSGGSLKLCQIIVLVSLCASIEQASGQGVKGANNAFSSSAFSNSASGFAPSTTSGQLSSSFMQMFNSLTPVQQQQFIRQMSSSNRRVFQQAFPQVANINFSEEVSSSGSGGGGGAASFGGTKSSAFRQSSSSALSPAQQNSFFRSQQSKSFVQPTIQPSSQFSFSRQVSQQVQQPTIIPQSNSESSFQLQKTVVNQIPQQQSYFNQVRQVSQVAQPVVLPSSESSFRRVQSFSSQPLPVETSSGFSQQFVSSQQQQQPVQTGFNKFQSFQQSSQVAQPVQTGFNQQFSSSSSSNGFGGGFGSSLSGFGGAGNSADFSSALQQEKVDQNGLSIDSNSISGLPGGFSSGSFESSSSGSGLAGGFGGLNSFGSNQQQSGFDSADVQQKNLLQGPEDYNGLTAASINNKWYIMKPVENPSALGLGEASSGQLRKLPASASQKLLLPNENSKSPQASQKLAPSTPSPIKKRQTSAPDEKEKKPKKASRSAAGDIDSDSEAPPSSSVSSLMEDEADKEEEQRK